MSAGAIIPGDVRTVPLPGPLGEGSAQTKPLADKAAPTASTSVPSGASAYGGDLPPKAVLSGQNVLSAGELFKQTAATLKLPVDSLSVTLLAFSRFFSLPPSQALIATLRREILTASDSSPKSAAEKAAFEAKAMAAVAAADKGVTLSPETLERYARFLEAPVFKDDGESGGKNAFNGGGSGKKNPQEREEVPDKEELRAIAGEEAKNDGFLDIMNSIPGKNGQYWAVFPFNIKVGGTELKVFLRVLKGEPLLTGENEHVIVDIAGPRRQYRCFLGKTSGKLRADIRVYPELSPKALKQFSKKAKSFLGEGSALVGNSLVFEEILVKNGDGVPSWAEILLAEPLLSIDKEV